MASGLSTWSALVFKAQEKLERSTRLLRTGMPSPNGLLCFTNCLLPQEDGKLVEKDLWIDEQRGTILDAQVGLPHTPHDVPSRSRYSPQRTFYERKQRPGRVVDLGGNILRS